MGLLRLGKKTITLFKRVNHSYTKSNTSNSQYPTHSFEINFNIILQII